MKCPICKRLILSGGVNGKRGIYYTCTYCPKEPKEKKVGIEVWL